MRKKHTKDGAPRYKVKVVIERNDTRLNRHQRSQLQGLQANCDLNIITDVLSTLQNMHQNQKDYQL